MDLTLSQLRDITVGALEIREDGDGFHFSRLTPEQEAAFTQMNATFGPKCKACSGIRLDFSTDAAYLCVHWHKAQVTTRRLCYFDVLVDGTLMLHSGTDDCGSQPEGRFGLDLPEGTHHVQIFLPTLVGFCLKSVTLRGGTALVPHRPARRFLFHGDSITQGYDALFPSACYANRLARHFDAEIVNQAVGGACFDPASPAYVGEFDAVFVGYGTNDWTKKSAAAFGADAEAFLQKLHTLYGSVPVFVILPIWRADADERQCAAGTFPACRARIGALARQQGFCVLDDPGLVPHDPRLFSDGYLHPNDVGFALYTRRLIELLEDRL